MMESSIFESDGRNSSKVPYEADIEARRWKHNSVEMFHMVSHWSIDKNQKNNEESELPQHIPD